MSQNARTLIAGNWKMNGLRDALDEVRAVGAYVKDRKISAFDVALCVPATLLAATSEVASDTGLKTGGEDCHAAKSGAHTGDISADMLQDAGAKYVIVGHSERRADHGETSAYVSAKAKAAFSAGLLPIICVGETEAQRKAGETLTVVAEQLASSVPDDASGKSFVIAYEPVWAIGTGLTPTIDDIAEVHSDIRQSLVARFGEQGQAIPLLYGGSMKPTNAAEILEVRDVNGGLIGGASLKAADFIGIIKAAEASA